MEFAGRIRMCVRMQVCAARACGGRDKQMPEEKCSRWAGPSIKSTHTQTFEECDSRAAVSAARRCLLVCFSRRRRCSPFASTPMPCG